MKNLPKTSEIRLKRNKAALTALLKTKMKTRETVSLEAVNPTAAPAKTKARISPPVTESKKQKQVTAQNTEYKISAAKTAAVPNLISALKARSTS